jgi:periplasmic protein TonB
MHEAVTDVLVARAHEADGLSRMVLVSVFAHGVLIAALVAMPASWRSPSTRADATPMMITLSSAGTGPDAGGRNLISGKPVQEEAPAESKPAPVAPPAPKAPEMVAPEPTAKPSPTKPPKPVEKPVDKSSARKPTTGPEVKAGDARVDTGGAPIEFGGLTRPSGGGLGASSVKTDYANFCCPAYLDQMVELIKRNWNQKQGASGEVQVKFTIRRDGTISDVQVEKPSGISLLDLESQRAMLKTRALPPLPREFTESTLTVHIIFDYHR